jgi:hypothetical protein
MSEPLAGAAGNRAVARPSMSEPFAGAAGNPAVVAAIHV